MTCLLSECACHSQGQNYCPHDPCVSPYKQSPQPQGCQSAVQCDYTALKPHPMIQPRFPPPGCDPAFPVALVPDAAIQKRTDVWRVPKPCRLQHAGHVKTLVGEALGPARGQGEVDSLLWGTEPFPASVNWGRCSLAAEAGKGVFLPLDPCSGSFHTQAVSFGGCARGGELKAEDAVTHSPECPGFPPPIFPCYYP